jgi:hypothetical protein
MGKNFRDVLYSLIDEDGWDYDRTIEDIREKRPLDDIRPAPAGFVCLIDPDYPVSMKNLYHPPLGFIVEPAEAWKELSEGEKAVVFVGGEDCLGIPTEKTARVRDGKALIGGKVSITSHKGKESEIAIAFSKAAVFEGPTPNMKDVDIALRLGLDVLTTPTAEPSEANRLIKEGAILIDRLSDLDGLI